MNEFQEKMSLRNATNGYCTIYRNSLLQNVRDLAQVAGWCLLTMKAQVQSRVTSCDEVALEQVLLRVFSISPC
jgi:hypothetical protein